jgi:hypothetical protein
VLAVTCALEFELRAEQYGTERGYMRDVGGCWGRLRRGRGEGTGVCDEGVERVWSGDGRIGERDVRDMRGGG